MKKFNLSPDAMRIISVGSLLLGCALVLLYFKFFSYINSIRWWWLPLFLGMSLVYFSGEVINLWMKDSPANRKKWYVNDNTNKVMEKYIGIPTVIFFTIIIVYVLYLYFTGRII